MADADKHLNTAEKYIITKFWKNFLYDETEDVSWNCWSELVVRAIVVGAFTAKNVKQFRKQSNANGYTTLIHCCKRKYIIYTTLIHCLKRKYIISSRSHATHFSHIYSSDADIQHFFTTSYVFSIYSLRTLGSLSTSDHNQFNWGYVIHYMWTILDKPSFTANLRANISKVSVK